MQKFSSNNINSDGWTFNPQEIVTKWAGEVDPDLPLAEYPNPQMRRDKWLCLNGLWNYYITKKRFSDIKSFRRVMNDPESSKIIKDFGKILVPYPIESALSGVGRKVLPSERLWYMREFVIPKDWMEHPTKERVNIDGKEIEHPGHRTEILLHFGAVDWECTVYVNGNKCGTHKGGYTPFTINITPYLDFSKEEQELIVSVWDPTNRGPQNRGKQVLHPWGVFYTSVTGIWQTVWIEPVLPIYIKDISMRPVVDEKILLLTVNFTFSERAGISFIRKNELNPAYSDDLYPIGMHGGLIECKAIIRFPHIADIPLNDKIKRAISDGEQRQIAEKVFAPDSETRIEIADPELWNPENPNLYDIEIILYERRDNKEPIIFDRIKSYFGFRKIGLIPDKGGHLRFSLNNKPIFLYGPLDQGYWPDGIYTPPSYEAMKFDLDATLEMGFNCIRKHIKIEPARWYYYCDLMGIPVIQDIPSAGLQTEIFLIMLFGRRFCINFQRRSRKAVNQFYAELEQIVKTLYNHPSVIMWVLFNEGWGQFQTRRGVRMLKTLDGSRLLNAASGWVDKGLGDIKDIHAYPGPAIPEPDDERKIGRKRALFNGEFGGIAYEVEGHVWNRNRKWGYRKVPTAEALEVKYIELTDKLKELIPEGLAGAIYTQTTDVEGEVNGLITYDRAVIKLDPAKLSKIHESIFKTFKDSI